MAWTEEPGNELADRLRAERDRKLRAVRAAATRLRSSDRAALHALGEAMDELLGFAGVGLRAPELAASDGGTPAAMNYVRERGLAPGCLLRFLHPGQTPLALPGLDHVRIYVLGPPEDEKLLKKSDPSKAHSEVYLASSDSFLAAADPAAVAAEFIDAASPFDPGFRISPEDPTTRAWCSPWN
jgi:hypothetical protein